MNTWQQANPAEARMFEIWGRAIYRRRVLALVIALIALAGAAAWGSGVFGSLQSSGGFTSPNSESQRASNLAASAFGRNDADVVVLYRSPAMTVADPAYRAAVTRSLAALPHGRVTAAQTYWSTGSARFVSTNRHETYAVLQLAGSSDDARTTSYNAIKNDLNAPRLYTLVGGNVPTYESINTEVKADIGRAEAFSMPVLLILLLVIFGSLTSALLPLAIGGTAIIGSFAVLRVLTLGTAVSTYSINITTILGLGLGIDYGLFMVGRFREELRRQPNVQDAVARTVATAGRTVMVSGITVAVALSSLMLFPEVFLRSMGYGGVATVLVDMLAALTLLPALLALLGHRVNSLRVRRLARPAVGHDHGGAWRRIAGSVMRRPVLYVVAIVAALLALGTPFLSVKWGGTDSRVLPASSQPHQVADALNRDFPVNATNPIEAVVQLPAPVSSPAGHAALAAYTGRLGHVAGVTGAQITGARGNVARVDLRYAPQAYSTQAREIVQRVRAVPGPAGATVLVGGITAGLVDELASIGQTLPWMALMVGLATFVLLFLAFGSVVLPLKAIVMNAASLAAAFGATVWIFQDGHLSGLLNFTSTGSIDPSMPILMLAIIFGLSMDYEVFLLSRVRERYDISGDNTMAVADGLQRTGGIITSAALLLIVVVAAFSASGIIFIKLLGVGMVIALLVDASVVRVLLVPATMRLLGRANWWAPGPLRRLYARYGIREEDGQRQPVTART
jgi:trehalose monomycolate/heme transporter